MPEYRSADGAAVFEVPAGYRVGPAVDAAPTRSRGSRRPGGGLPKGAVPIVEAPSGTTDAIVAALVSQGFTVVGEPVAIGADPSRSRRAAVASATATVEVGADEDAVMLVEQDGLYVWQLPASYSTATRRSGARRDLTEPPRSTRTITFTPGLAGSPTSERNNRGALGTLLFRGARTLILKFAAGVITKSVMRHLENGIVPKLVRITAPDPATWSPADIPSLEKALPQDRPPKILLFVHGTFSSTVGGFGSLATHDAGRHLLGAALEEYDAVLGYDHLTLSVDPSANAAELIGFLRQIAWPQPPVFDIVTHSRGALVTRSFVEQALPVSGWAARSNAVVFAAGTNAGTELANPKNWKTLVDVYTNLAAAGARFVPQPVVATILAEAIKSVGALVKYLVSYATDGDGVPGVAAMEPGGAFVTELNRNQPGQPVPSTSLWYVIASNFEPKLLGDGAPSIPARLLSLVADAFVDQLMGTANDLVVNTNSMAAIDAPVGTPSGFVDGRLDYTGDDAVFHTVYFAQPRTAQAIGGWLGLPPQGPTTTRRRKPTELSPPRGRGRRVPLGAEESMPEAGSPFGRVPVGRVSDVRGPSGHFGHSGAVLLPDLAFDVLDGSSVVDAGRGRRSPAGSGGPARKASAKKAVAKKATRTRGQAARTGAEPGTTDTVFLRAAMAARATVDVVTTLRCTVGREALAALGGAEATGAAGADTAKPITVQVVAKDHLDVVGADRADIPVPAPGSPTDLYFDVMPRAVGTGEVHVLLRQGPVPLVTLALKPEFVATTAGAAETGLTGGSVGNVPSVAPATCVRQWLRITERRLEGATFYDLELEAEDLGQLVKASTPPLVGDRATYVKDLYDRIESRWLSNADDSAAFGAELRALGGELFDELIPPEIGAALWKYRKRLKNVLVMSDEPFIPWEIVHLKNGPTLPRETLFLGKLGSMRWTQGTYPVATLTFDKSRYVVPDYPEASGLRLPETGQEADFVKTTLHGTAITASPAAVRKALQKPGSFDHLHFAGHGEASDTGSRILLTGRIDTDADGRPTYVMEDLTDTAVGQWANLATEDGRRPFVMLNACQAGRRATRLTSLGGFAQAFVDRGAGAFVSSLWAVGDEPARVFAETLYTSLLDGDTLAEATIAARTATAKVGGDATWLAYVVYGNPCARLVSAR